MVNAAEPAIQNISTQAVVVRKLSDKLNKTGVGAFQAANVVLVSINAHQVDEADILVQVELQEHISVLAVLFDRDGGVLVVELARNQRVVIIVMPRSFRQVDLHFADGEGVLLRFRFIGEVREGAADDERRDEHDCDGSHKNGFLFHM